MFQKTSWQRLGTPAGLLGACLALGLTGVAHGLDDPDSISSLAGIYSSAHTVKVNSLPDPTFGYIEIDKLERTVDIENQVVWGKIAMH